MNYRIIKQSNGMDEKWFKIQYRYFWMWWDLKIHYNHERYSSYPEAQGVLDRYIKSTERTQRNRKLRRQITTEVMPYTYDGQEK